MINGLAGFNGIDEMIQGRNDELSKVHPIDPASIPNPFIGMKDDLPKTTPESIYKNEHLQLMDAGMSNNLPLCSFSYDNYLGIDLLLVRPFITSRPYSRRNYRF